MRPDNLPLKLHFSSLLLFLLSIEAIAQQCFSHSILLNHSQPDSMKKKLSKTLSKKKIVTYKHFPRIPQ